MMGADIWAALPARRGHFRLESGYHTDLWLSLEALFVDPQQVAPLITALADRLRPYGVEAVCGCLMGGAFLAQALAMPLGVSFYYTEPRPAPADGLFKAEYRLPLEFQRRVYGQRVAVVDDVISAGSSVRATVTALTAAGASTAVVGSLLALGEVGLAHFAQQGVPVETLARRDCVLWQPVHCPLCRTGVPFEDPTQG